MKPEIYDVALTIPQECIQSGHGSNQLQLSIDCMSTSVDHQLRQMYEAGHTNFIIRIIASPTPELVDPSVAASNTHIDLNELQAELERLGEDGNSDVVMRGLIVMSQLGDLCRFITHDLVLNPTVRPHENPSLEAHAAGHALCQLMTLVAKRGINIEDAINLGLADLREHTCVKKLPSMGVVACPGTVCGRAWTVDYRQAHGPRDVYGMILVANHITSDVPVHWFSGVVTDEGGMMCHAAIVCRERGIPCVVGMGNITSLVAPGDAVMIDNGNVRVIKQ